MSAPKILVISNTPFFGGGEAFIVDTLVHLREPLYYLVRNTTLADSLPADRVFRFSKTSFAGQLSEVRRVIAGLDPDCVIFNGGRTLFFVPWVRAKRKILYRHTTNQCIGNRLICRCMFVTPVPMPWCTCPNLLAESKNCSRTRPFVFIMASFRCRMNRSPGVAP